MENRHIIGRATLATRNTFAGWCPESATMYAWHFYDDDGRDTCTCEPCVAPSQTKLTAHPDPDPDLGTGWIEGIGTVRPCIDCGLLVVGGPTRCLGCVRKIEKKSRAQSGARVKTREALAALAHIMWAGWMTYLFEKCECTADGQAVIPAELVERWQRQIATPYKSLSETEKQSDRVQADKMLALIEDDYRRKH
jgi:hypothetical protein